MKQVDYLVVGLGIAGLSFCQQLRKTGKSFVVVDTPKTNSTLVAGGVVNPVVLKRFTLAWQADIFIEEAYEFYTALQDQLGVHFLSEIPIDRIFANAQEQNDWMVASDTTRLSSFLSSEIAPPQSRLVKAPFKVGRVHQSFRVDTKTLLEVYRNYLDQQNQLLREQFSYQRLEIFHSKVVYRKISAKKIVFAQGANVVNNPFFTLDCLIPKKGEYLFLKAPKLKLKSILKGSYFVIPLEKDLYQAGATFVHGDDSNRLTQKSESQIVTAVNKMIDCPYKIVGQVSGLRPTVKDRRPLLGPILDEKIIFFNGLGTRGILMAPTLSQNLYDLLENKVSLPTEVDIKRFL